MKFRAKKNNEVSGSKRLIASFLLGAFLPALCPITLFAQEPSARSTDRVTVAQLPSSEKEEKSEVFIKADVGGTVTLGEASIEIPEGALKEDTTISITRLKKVEDTGESLYNAIPKSGGYRFLPAGTKFEKDVTITLPYNAELNSKPQSLEDLYTYFYDTEMKSWVKLERLEVDKENLKVRSLTTHFTDMINATLTLPESASPVDVNLNSIKNLEAAKPDGHLIKFNPPKASNMGDASFSFELAIPGGRRGMQPQISVSYSSGGGNGIMGKGFDVSYNSSITTDTRFGLPKYDTHDTYMLDGIILDEENQRSGTTVYYKPEKESSYSRIIRYGAGTANDWWEVTDKSGTKKLYEQKSSSCVGSGSKTFTWNLTKTIDVYGNTVVYEYENVENYVYPKTIYYTGNEAANYIKETGSYSVSFHYDNEGEGAAIQRDDVRYDVRSTQVSVCKKLLTSITTHYKGGSFIRKYSFTYKEGLAKEKMMTALSVSNNADESYQYTFDYVEPEMKNGQVVYFATAEEWGHGQPLQLGKSTNIGATFNGAAGVGYGTDFIDAHISGGGSGSVSSGESYTEETLIDINGDGRPDSVKQTSEGIFVILNKNGDFSEEHKLVLKGRSFEGDLDYEKTESSTVAWNIYAGAAAKSIPVSLGVGYSEVYQKSSSQTMCSFMDMDRDGLVDLVETGKSTYFKNMGDFTFEERNIYSNVSVSDVTVKVSDEEKKEYRQTYYVQTPFRMWKSPYEGIVTITETASRRADNFESAHKVDLKTFVGASQNPVSELGMTVSSTTPVSKEKSGIEIEKGTNYYFISDNGIEPSGTDLNWNINIEYTDIKSFKVSDVQPFMNLESFYEITGDERAYDKKEDAKKEYPAIFAREKLNGDLPLADMFSYPIREVEHENNGVKTYTYYISAVYNRTWPKSITDEEQKKAIVSILMKKNLLMPRVLTEAQFNEYLKEVQKEKNIGEFKETKDYYQAFAQQFTHSIPDNLYTLKRFADNEADNNDETTKFFKTFPMPENVQKGALQNYVRNGIMPSFSVDKAYYLNQKNQDFDKVRSLYENGTLSGNLIVAGTYDSAVIYIDRSDNKLKRCVQSGDTKTYESVDIPYDIKLKPTDLDEFTVQYDFNIDEKKVYESTVNISFKGLSYRAENLNAEEFQKIYDHIEVDYSKVSDSHWNLPDTEDENERQKRIELDFLFKDMKLLTEEQKLGIIDALYEQKIVYEEVEENEGTGDNGEDEGNAENGEAEGEDEEAEEPEPKPKYKYYALKLSPSYDVAQTILDAYKKEVIMQEKYPFYNEDENGDYLLKDEWKEVKEKEIAKEEWNEEIRNEVAADPEVDAEDPDAVEAAVEKLFEDKYKIYLDMHEHLVSECQYFNFGKYESVAVTQEFNAEYLSKINKNEKSYTLFMAENNLHFATRKFTLAKTTWNAANDYSFNNINKERGIYSYIETETVKVDETSEPKDENINTDIMISNEEFLYGGVDRWYYGIWKGSLADVPFTEDKLLEFKKDVGTFESKEAFEEKKNSVPQTISEDDKKQKKEDTVHFYTPQKISESAYPNGIDKSLVSSLSDGSEVDLNKSLIGIVATYTEIKKVNGVKQSVDEYFMPYIFGDVIHADRAGGKSYYKIEGLKDETPPSTQVAHGSPLSMPAVRKSYVSGTDKTPTAKIGLGPVSVDISQSRNESSGNKSFNLGISGPMGGGSMATNLSYATSQQIIQDLNADGIPDIVQIDSSSLKITEGKKVNEIGDVCYDAGSTISGIEYISKNETNTTTMGGSVSVQGSSKIEPKTGSLGNIKNIQIVTPATPSASSGITYSRGTSVQSHGLGDINGDGLPDYYDGGAYKLSNGSQFMSNYRMFGDVSQLSESQNYSIGTNFSIPIGMSGSGDIAEAKSLTTGVSGSVGLTYNSSSSNTKKMMMDINGDGLQDILSMEPGSTSITVQYNTGNKFTNATSIALPDWTNKDNFNYVTGNLTQFLWSDSDAFDLGIIGDVPVIGSAVSSGMKDIAINPFGFGAQDFANSLDWNTSISLGLSGSVGLNVDIAFRFFAIFVYVGTLNITVSGGAGVNASTSLNGANVKMTDLDGDGLVDHVLRVPGLGTFWKRNISGRYGQLVRVNMPQGGNVNIEYTESYGTPSNPNFKYVMSRVTMNDGTDGYGPLPKLEHGAHSLTTVYNYKDGFYDRQRKDFLGFETVTTTNADGTYQVDTYNNRKYYLKGSVLRSVSYAKDGTKLSESETKYMNAPVALPRIEESWTYEKNGDGSCIYSATEYTYDGWGNCTKVVQSYGDGVTLTGEILYDNTETEKYIIGLPVDIVVYGKNGITDFLRHRHGDYNDFGQLIELRQYFGKNTEDYSVNYLTYDDHYGNIKSVEDSNGATLSYTYDEYVHSFVTQIDQFGNGTKTYTSKIKYFESNIAVQTKDYEEDCNGNKLSYKYDNWQRIERIWTSYDKEENPAVKYEYHTSGKDSLGAPELWYAITDNKVTFDQNNTSVIQTVLQVDGLGRAVRTAKTGYVNGKLGWNASGAVEYDNKGRTTKEGMTEFIEGSLTTLLNKAPSMTALYTSYVYDEKDRQIETVLPDNNKQYSRFEIIDGKSVTSSKDPLGNISIQESDSRGNIIRIAKQDSNGKELTKVTYRYNEMGEMLKAFDAKGHPVTAEYDKLGRRTALESLDSGRQEYVYDKCSNLIFETNSELRDHNKQIQYFYDGLNRLVMIDYPDTKDTLYTYGEPGDMSVGAAGKILKVEDASGTLEYEYGKLGEVTKETRVLATHLNGPKSEEEAVMQYRSDYLGRMQWIIYPDGEKITYGYDDGGQVVSVTGMHNDIPFSYVKNILYDEYGQRTRIDYGNGTYTVYNYDPARRWLDSINTKNQWGQNFQNIKYDFDPVGNVLGYVNDCLDSTSGNYRTEQTYTYDNLYQLINVEGNTTYNPSHSVVPEFESKYTQAFSFDTDGLGNMTSKVSKESVSPDISVGDNLNYSLDYVYDSKYAHRLVRAGTRYYKYDANGNITCEQDGAFEGETAEVYHKISEEAEDVYSTDYGWGLVRDEASGNGAGGSQYHRTYSWNEKNQLIGSIDASFTTSYIYGQDGQRSNKYTDSSETLYFNKMWTLHTDSGNRDKGGQFAKNIYLGDTRIVTKLKGYEETTVHEETYKQYFYHSDHLGSASLISDYEGKEYQRIEYTPYGETWVEKTQNIGSEFLPYKFTAKELDEETGLYYYGARYLDPKYSMWISTDPALGEYIPKAPVDEEAKKYNQNLPGMGGVFNHINANLYHYAGNNPINYTDPDGRTVKRWLKRNTNNLISLGGDTVEIATGVIGLGASCGLSSLMIAHGSINATYTITKMCITTYIANVQGDDAADIAEANMPSSALGALTYGLACMVDSIVGYKNENWEQAMGAVGDMLDFAIGVGLSAGFEKSIAESLSKMDPSKINNFEKLLKLAKENKVVQISENAYTILTGLIQDIKTAKALVEAY